MVANGRGGGAVSYDLYIIENENFYKIAAENSDCFYPGLFERDVKAGQSIKFWLKDSFFSKPMIVRLVANKSEYFSFNCANTQIEKDRTEIPILIFIVTVLICGVIYKKEIKAKLT